MRFVLITIFSLVTASIVAGFVNPAESDKELIKGICGTKLANKLFDYATFHENILNKKDAQRYLVSVPVEAGLADRLIGIISQFWLAFFSKRAFQIGSYEKLPHFEDAYDYRFVNWTRPPDPMKYTASLMFTYKGIRGYDRERKYDPKEVDPEAYFGDYIINQDGRIFDLFGKEDLTTYPRPNTAYPKPHTVFTSSNRGGIQFLFNNPKMSTYLKELEMDKYAAFRCAYAFLFRENSAVERITEPFRKKLLSATVNSSQANSALMIGIGIRAGDASFDPRRDAQLSPHVFERHTRCAEHVESNFKMSHEKTNVVWYVMSESLRTREMIDQRYRSKVVVDTSVRYFHGDCSKHTTGGCEQEHLRDAIQYAVSQLQLFAMCNVHIFPSSGFPRVGAMLSSPPYHMYALKGKNDGFGDCKYDTPMSMDAVMNIGAGI